MAGTPPDGALILFPEADLTDINEGDQAPLYLDGVADGELYVAFEAPTGTNPTLDVIVKMNNADPNTTYSYPMLRRFTSADVPDASVGLMDRFEFSRPIFITGSKMPADGYQPSPTVPTVVTLNLTVGGTSTPTFPNFSCWINTELTGRTPERIA